jgi:hypothetical protein
MPASSTGKPFTATERRILDLLGDGLHHPRADVKDCLNDELASYGNLVNHISAIRKRLRPRGQDIICERFNCKYGYRWVRLLKSPDDGSGNGSVDR